MARSYRFGSFAFLALWSTAAIAGEARLQTDSRGCYLIQVSSYDVRPTRVTVRYSLLGLPDNRYQIDLQPQQSQQVHLVPGNSCLRAGDIRITGVSTYVINPNGTLGSVDLNRQTPDLIEDILRRNRQIEQQNKDLAERRRLAREARRQRELELKAARERNAIDVQRIFAMAKDQQLEALRRQFPGCIINLGYTQAEITQCARAAILIKEDKLKEAKLAEERAASERVAAAHTASLADAERLHNEYLALAQASPDRCWGYRNYARYHPEPQPPQLAATQAQIRAAMEQYRQICGP